MAPRPLFVAFFSLALATFAFGTSLDLVDDATLLRMGANARRVSDRLVEKDLTHFEVSHGLREASEHGLGELSEQRLRDASAAHGLRSDSFHGLSTDPTPFERSSGFFKLNRTSAAEMFYFYFQSRDADPVDPVVLWMTGGPGCSSELALFAENGPYTVNSDASTLSVNPFGWDQVSNLIYVDQPIGTGFSFSTNPADDVHDEKRVAVDMLEFLTEFSEAHPELKGRDFYITGESYAGHYVPAVSYAVFKAQEKGRGPAFKLKGLAIGNGLTEPEIQYGAYADYALGMGLVDEKQAQEARRVYPMCRKMIHACGGSVGPDGPSSESDEKAATCTAAVDFCQSIPGSLLEAAGDVNVYDVRKPCTVPGLCYDFSHIDAFLNLQSTRDALGVGDRKWEACSPHVHADMMADWMRDLEPTVPPMLEGGLRVLVYAGENDFICNWLGNKRWVEAMPWSGQEDFNKHYPVPFVVDGATGGDVVESGLLSFLKMSESGHMVPMDQPANALEMLRRFVHGEAMAGDKWDPGCCGSGGDKSSAKTNAPRRAAVVVE